MVSANLATQVENRTQELGRRMFAATRAAAPGPLQYEWWEERMLQQFMQYEWLKVQAFRFIDALPTLGSDAEVAQHMREYFVHPRYGPQPNGHVNGRPALQELEPAADEAWVYGLVSRLMNFRNPRSVLAKFFVWLSRQSAAMMAGSFIAGSNIDEAVAAIRRMRAQSQPFTIDVLGEAAVSRQEAQQYHDTYLHLISELPKHAANWPMVPLCDLADGEPIPRVNVSVKITSLFPGFDPLAWTGAKDRAKDLLRPLFRKAVEGGVHLHVDMEHYAIKDLTLEVYEDLLMEPEFRDYPHFGIVLQAYLRDGDADGRRIIEFARRRGVPTWVRLVKGAYWDSETVWAAQRGWPVPVWSQKWESDACYERMSRDLLENHEHVYSAFASHNIRSLCYALALKEAIGVPNKAFEWQMLFGMGNPMKRAAVRMGQRCRVYTPYGEMMPGMAYLIRRLLENTANESFLRHTGDEAAEQELLENPEETGRHTPPPEEPVVIRYEFEEEIMDPFVNVPNSDFALEENRRRMQTALGEVRAERGGEYPLIIDGQPVKPAEWYDSIDPSRPREVIGRIGQAGPEDVDRAVAAARRAFGEWRHTDPEVRRQVLANLAELLSERRFELAALAVFECGKPWREADADVSEAIDYCNYYAQEIRRITGHMRRRDIPGELNEYTYVPCGVAAVMSHWNFPLALATGMTAAALVTGNTVVFQPAKQAAVSAARIVKLYEEAGLPPGVLNYLPGSADVSEALAQHADVAIVSYTGPRDLGLRLHQLSASSLTAQPGYRRFVAETGGKNAIIVDADANLDEAIKGVLSSAFDYAGQKCSACSRAIVVGNIYDRMMSRLVEAAESKTLGPADEPTTAIPPLIDQAAYDRVREYIDVGKQEGTCVLETDTSELVGKSGGYYVGPTIFADVPRNARVAREEIFGPVLVIQRAADINEAIELFNDCDYALTGGIYSRSPANIEQVRHRCECGNFYINRVITGAQVDLQPFGGFKLSGVGSKVGGPDYLLQFCEQRTVTENTLRRGFAPSEDVQQALA